MDFEIRHPRQDELVAIAELHQTNLPGTLNTVMGTSHLVSTYEATLTHPGSALYIATGKDGLIGFVVVSMNASSLTSHIMSHLSWAQRIALLRKVSMHPSLWVALAQGAYTGLPLKYKGQVVEPTMAVLATNKARQGKGVARALATACEDFVKQHGGRIMNSQTRRSNKASRAFHAKIGYVEVEKRALDVFMIKEW